MRLFICGSYAIALDHAVFPVAIINYLKYNPYLAYVIYPIGFGDIQFEFHLENSNKIIQIMDDINSKFPNIIRKYAYISAQKVHKERWLPELQQ